MTGRKRPGRFIGDEKLPWQGGSKEEPLSERPTKRDALEIRTGGVRLPRRRLWLLLAMVVVVTSSVAAQEIQSDSAEALTKLQQPPADDRETTLSWFRFLLPRIVRNCSDIDSETFAATLIVRTNGIQSVLQSGGAAEAGDLLRWTRVLERLSDTLSTIFAPLGASFDCAEALAMFAVRGRRASSEETEEAVLAEYMRTWVILGRSHVRPLWDREHVESVLEHSR